MFLNTYVSTDLHICAPTSSFLFLSTYVCTYLSIISLFLLIASNAGAEEAVSGWVGSSEYICHMEQSKISGCNAC